MSSYVISVSLGTGCYRHIQISASATLYKLHKAIIGAFNFDDDHQHVFFMDNRAWSDAAAFFSSKMKPGDKLTKNRTLKQLKLTKGSQFKYIFDFGDEWSFQCKVLREDEDDLDIPFIVRSVGEAPVQYQEDSWDDEWEMWDDEDEDEDYDMGITQFFSQDIIQDLLKTIPLPQKTVSEIYKYFEAAARFYSIIQVGRLFEIYNEQNKPVSSDAFCMFAEIISHEANAFFVILDVTQFTGAAEAASPMDWVLIDYAIIVEGSDKQEVLMDAQETKPLKVLPKEEFLLYAKPDYLPVTPQSTAMKKYLQNREAIPEAEELWESIMIMVERDVPLADVLRCLEEDGLTFDGKHDIGEFVQLLQELNDHTRKSVNRGHTPAEIFAQSPRGQKLAEKNAPTEQMSLFDID